MAEQTTVVVPREPTRAMLDEVRDWSRAYFGTAIGDKAARGCWNAMLRGAARADPASSPDLTIVVAYDGGRLDAFNATLKIAKTMTRAKLIEWLEGEIASF